MKKLLLPLAAAVLLVGAGCTQADLPEETNIDVPFTSQAPEGNWSEPWQNACEETSVYMVSSFYADDEIKREEAVARIKEIVAKKNETFKVSEDESLETIQSLIKELGLPLNTEIAYDPTVDQIKTELAAGHPIIAPVFAPKLVGPKYDGGGPDYHVLVLTGYDDDTQEFIANDPGASNGQGIRFPYDQFMDAIHDLNQEEYTKGQKALLFTSETGWQAWFDNLTE